MCGGDGEGVGGWSVRRPDDEADYCDGYEWYPWYVPAMFSLVTASGDCGC